MVVHNWETRKAEAEGSQRVQSQPGLNRGFKATVNYVRRPCLENKTNKQKEK